MSVPLALATIAICSVASGVVAYKTGYDRGTHGAKKFLILHYLRQGMNRHAAVRHASDEWHRPAAHPPAFLDDLARKF